VILAGILLALFMTSGEWIRGPLSAATITISLVSGLGVALLECAAIMAARKIQRLAGTKAAAPPS